MSASPCAINRAPNIKALAAEEHAVESVVHAVKQPKWSAISCVVLPPSCVLMQSASPFPADRSAMCCSVMSIPPTVVPEMSTTRRLFKCGSDESSPASASDSRTASMPNSTVRLTSSDASMPNAAFISSLDKGTSPTGSSRWVDERYFIGPIPRRCCTIDCHTSA